MNTSYIWVVSGSTGAYSDRFEWNVCAYNNEQDAQNHAAKAQAEADLIFKNSPCKYSIDNFVNKYDPKMNIGYTGTTYSISMVEIKDKFEEIF